MFETEVATKGIGDTLKPYPFSLPLMLFYFKAVLHLVYLPLKLTISSLFFTALEARTRISTLFPPHLLLLEFKDISAISKHTVQS